MIAFGLLQIVPLALFLAPGAGIPSALFVILTGAAFGAGVS